MLIGVIKEKTTDEKRVAITPTVVKRLNSDGIHTVIEHNAGKKAGFSDEDYIEQGASIGDSPQEICNSCNMLFKIKAPLGEEWNWLTHQPIILADFSSSDTQPIPCRAFALEKIPRISKAQSIDILSSQNNLSGYKAVIVASNLSQHIMPMMITAAGTLPPLHVFIWGLGVAGLQAAATAKRLGAKVYVSDIRPETEEQATSVGAFFIPSDEILPRLSGFDIIITAAGSPDNAPILIDKSLYQNISKKTLLLDISGNVEKTIPTTDNLYRKYNLPSEVAHDASTLFANNIYNFFRLIYDFQAQDLNLDFNDEIISKTYIGERIHV